MVNPSAGESCISSIKKSMVESSKSFKDALKMIQYWMESTHQAWYLAFFIILATYLLEDAAIISAALLTADGAIASELAFFALFVGIFSGDLGLYGLGKVLGKWQWLVNRVNTEKVKEAGVWLEKRMISTILLVRVIPGLRLPTYLACGYFELSFLGFFLLVALASLLWTGAIFYSVYWFGSMFWAELSEWKWLFLPAIVGLFLIIHRKAVSKKIIKTMN